MEQRKQRELRRLGLVPDGGTDWSSPESRGAAGDYCWDFASRHRENFTIASWVLPASVRRHFAHVYAYCRAADDFADQVADSELSLELLDDWQRQMEACHHGECTHPIFQALRGTIDEFALPLAPFLQLLEAFRRDQRQREYQDVEDLLSYCRCSADPVGRIILGLARCLDDPVSCQLSDSICTGLQWINFCQDVMRDDARGRIYLPRSTRAAFGYSDAMWRQRERNAAFLGLMRCEVARAEHFLEQGSSLIERVPRPFRFQVALFLEGGLSVARAIRSVGYDVWSSRPVVGRFGRCGVVARTLARRLGVIEWIRN